MTDQRLFLDVTSFFFTLRWDGRIIIFWQSFMFLFPQERQSKTGEETHRERVHKDWSVPWQRHGAKVKCLREIDPRSASKCLYFFFIPLPHSSILFGRWKKLVIVTVLCLGICTYKYMGVYGHVVVSWPLKIQLGVSPGGFDNILKTIWTKAIRLGKIHETTWN